MLFMDYGCEKSSVNEVSSGRMVSMAWCPRHTFFITGNECSLVGNSGLLK